eukprot:SM000027S09697  [mRNA]  locus=s27:878856:881525:- [translate_table: standard]
MSSVYVVEPPTRGKVVLATTMGDVDVELWPKEAPKATRNFVQLCADGYYDGAPFHRVIKGFMVQGGDPTGTGTGGASIYGAPFADEIHSRLRFSHRGLVACANAGAPNSNNSQFFFTLDRCDWLNKKHTIFGKVTGDTVYNMMQLGDVEVGDDDRPLYPPSILSVEVIWNPFDDIVPRKGLHVEEDRKSDGNMLAAPPAAKEKEKKKLNLLSFGEEAEEEEQELDNVQVKIKSSHDVLHDDPRLLRGDIADDDSKPDPEELKRREGLKTSVRQALAAGSRKDALPKLEEPAECGDERVGDDKAARSPLEGKSDDDSKDDDDFDARMRRQIMEKRRTRGDTLGAKADRQSQREAHSCLANAADRLPGSAAHSQRPPPPPPDKPAEQDPVSDSDPSSDEGEDSESGEKESGPSKKGRRKVERLLLKKRGLGSEGRAAAAVKADTEGQMLTPLEQERRRLQQKSRRQLELIDQHRVICAARSGLIDVHSMLQTLAKLDAFRRKLSEAQAAPPTEASQTVREATKSGDDDEEGDRFFLMHRLKFAVDPFKKDDMARNNDPNQYVVHDPLLERGKSKFNKEQAKLKKRGREWAGKSMD